MLISPGRPVRDPRGGGGDLHDDGALAGVAQVLPHSLPPAELQARHEADGARAGAAEGDVQRGGAAEPVPARGAGPHRAGVRQPARGAVPHQAPPAHPARLQGGEQ
eukprot:1140176-Prorocentrum_minimum.AAC.1